jgi:hypothetical protein
MTQDAFVTLKCPYCGGTREVKPGSGKAVCEYCGSEFIVSPHIAQNLRASASACPVCGHDDRVEKVLSIIAGQVQQIQGITVQQQPIVTRQGRLTTQVLNVPYTLTQSTGLAQQLRQPQYPNLVPLPPKPTPFTFEGYKQSGKAMKNTAFIILGFFILIAVCYGFSLLSDTNTTNQNSVGATIFSISLCSMTGLIISGVLWWLGNRQQHLVKKPENIVKREQESQAQQLAYQQAVQAHNAQIEAYNQATKNWNNLHYCYRDDCVFFTWQR